MLGQATRTGLKLYVRSRSRMAAFFVFGFGFSFAEALPEAGGRANFVEAARCLGAGLDLPVEIFASSIMPESIE